MAKNPQEQDEPNLTPAVERPILQGLPQYLTPRGFEFMLLFLGYNTPTVVQAEPVDLDFQ